MHTDMGLMTVLPPSMANEVRNDRRLSFTKHTEKVFMAQYPGFEVFRDSEHNFAVSLDVIKGKLTQALTKLTEPLSEECTIALEETLGHDRDWHPVCVKEHILQLVARLSSRVFLGEELCRDRQWLDITISYTVDAFMAADELHIWNPVIRPFVHWFLPRCRRLRAQMKEAYAVIGPVVEARRARRVSLAESSEGLSTKEQKSDSAIEWLDMLAKGRAYDPVRIQLGLSLAAIHTTSDLITQTLFNLAEHSEYLEPLRDEINEVVAAEGWTKTALYKMKLLDSVIKESQRLKPISLLAMQREVTETLTLSDGSILRKGSHVSVSAQRMWDASVHADPLAFDGYRFLKMRAEPGHENLGQLVTTSPDHLAFGHGTHACPGRFFAAHEVKLALARLLTEYDVRLLSNSQPKFMVFGMSLNADPFAKLEVRKRESMTT